MAPKHHETYLSESRIEELKSSLEEKGIDMKGVHAAELEWIDKAIKAHWKCPAASALEEMKSATPKKEQKKRLVTYAIHSAREHLGEPVGQKHEA
jgi:hypothetical protein